jgi:hypothetical protein
MSCGQAKAEKKEGVMSKRDTQKSHFRRRVYERYSISINEGEYDFLVSKVRKNDKEIVTFLMKQSNRITVHLIRYKDTEIVAVYDKLRKALVTALPATCRDTSQIDWYIEELGDT